MKNFIIIITGISGTEKSTIAKRIWQHFENSTLLSMDTLKETLFDMLGFQNREEKQVIHEFTHQTMEKLIHICCQRKDHIIIVEYPFQKDWKQIFEKIANVYSYELITINTYEQNFEIIEKRLEIREKSPERHIAHALDSYDSKYKNQYIRKSIDQDRLERRKLDFQNKNNNQINWGTIINLNELSEEEIDKIIKKLEVKVLNS